MPPPGWQAVNHRVPCPTGKHDLAYSLHSVGLHLRLSCFTSQTQLVYISDSAALHLRLVALHLRLSWFTSQTSCFTPHVGLLLCWFDSVDIHIRPSCYKSHL